MPSIARPRIGTRPVAAFAVALVATGALSGCVSQRKYDAASLDNRNLREQLSQLEQQRESLEDALASEREQRERAERAALEADRALADARRDLTQAESAFRELGDTIDSIPLMQLDPRTDRALRELARQYAGRIVYDPDRGMLRFASDLTFASGSDAVTAEGRESLEALAGILSAPEAIAYELEIIGHTDSQPISAATAQRHPTNMHLSAHRAISVRRELVKLGLPSNSIKAAGWGEHRPMVPNTSSGNTPQNRRVEVFIRPTGDADRSTASGSGGAVRADVDDARGRSGGSIDK